MSDIPILEKSTDQEMLRILGRIDKQLESFLQVFNASIGSNPQTTSKTPEELAGIASRARKAPKTTDVGAKEQKRLNRMEKELYAGRLADARAMMGIMTRMENMNKDFIKKIGKELWGNQALKSFQGPFVLFTEMWNQSGIKNLFGLFSDERRERAELKKTLAMYKRFGGSAKVSKSTLTKLPEGHGLAGAYVGDKVEDLDETTKILHNIGIIQSIENTDRIVAAITGSPSGSPGVPSPWRRTPPGLLGGSALMPSDTQLATIGESVETINAPWELVEDRPAVRPRPTPAKADMLKIPDGMGMIALYIVDKLKSKPGQGDTKTGDSSEGGLGLGDLADMAQIWGVVKPILVGAGTWLFGFLSQIGPAIASFLTSLAPFLPAILGVGGLAAGIGTAVAGLFNWTASGDASRDLASQRGLDPSLVSTGITDPMESARLQAEMEAGLMRTGIYREQREFVANMMGIGPDDERLSTPDRVRATVRTLSKDDQNAYAQNMEGRVQQAEANLERLRRNYDNLRLNQNQFPTGTVNRPGESPLGSQGHNVRTGLASSRATVEDAVYFPHSNSLINYDKNDLLVFAQRNRLQDQNVSSSGQRGAGSELQEQMISLLDSMLGVLEKIADKNPQVVVNVPPSNNSDNLRFVGVQG